MFTVTEKYFYFCLLLTAALVAILLPIFLVQTSDSIIRQLHFGPSEDVEGYIDDYLNLPQLDEYLSNFVQNHNLFFDLDQIGITQSNNSIKNVIMTNFKRKPLIVVVSGLLADDWRSVLVVLHLMNDFMAKCSKMNHLLNHIHFHFIPLLNPDGYNHSMSLPIFHNWQDNYSPRDHSGVNILHNFNSIWNQSEQESAAFAFYLQRFQNEIKAIIFLFSPQETADLQKKIITFPAEFAPKNSFKFDLTEKLLTALAYEVDNVFQYLPSAPKDPSLNKGRIDKWVVKKTEPRPLLVISVQANYKKGSSENTRDIIKGLGTEISTIIRALARVLAVKNI